VARRGEYLTQRTLLSYFNFASQLCGSSRSIASRSLSIASVTSIHESARLEEPVN